MDISLSEFDITDIDRSKKYSIVGKHESGKSFLVKQIIENSRHEYGVLITNLSHMKNVYTELDPINMYKKYSTLLKDRCFMNHMYLVLDDYLYNVYQLEEIKENLKKVDDFLFISSYPHFLNVFDFDFIFITSPLDDSILLQIHEKHLNNIKFKYFKKLVNMCCDNNEFLIINTMSSENKFMYLEKN